MLERLHFFPGLVLLVVGLALQSFLIQRLSPSRRRDKLVRLCTTFSTLLLLSGYLLELHGRDQYVPAAWATWIQCASLIETLCLIGVSLAVLAWSASPKFEPQRRSFLKATGTGLCLAPIAGAGFGIIHRNRFELSEVRTPIPGLPRDLD